MLSKQEYGELSKYCSGPIRNADGPTPMVRHLCEAGYLEIAENSVLPELTIRAVAWTITTDGEIALSEYRKNRKENIFDRIFQVFLVILGAFLALLAERLLMLLH